MSAVTPGKGEPLRCSWPMYDAPEVQRFNDVVFEAFRKECLRLTEQNISALQKKHTEGGSAAAAVFCDSLDTLEQVRRSLAEGARLTRVGQSEELCQSLWREPTFLFTHMCGQLYYSIAREQKDGSQTHQVGAPAAATAGRAGAGSLEPIFVPLYACHAGCKPGQYCSSIITRATSRFSQAQRPGRPQPWNHPDDLIGQCSTAEGDFSSFASASSCSGSVEFNYRRLAGSRLAVNSPGSFSGAILLQSEVARTSALLRDFQRSGQSSSSQSPQPLISNSKLCDVNDVDLLFDPDVLVTGSHRDSLRAVKEGRADVASIDCVTLTLLQKHCHEETSGITILLDATGTRHPAPPVVMPQELVKAGIGDLVFAAFNSLFSSRKLGRASSKNDAGAGNGNTGGHIATGPRDSTVKSELDYALEQLGLVGIRRVDGTSYCSHFGSVNDLAAHAPICLWSSAPAISHQKVPLGTAPVTQDVPLTEPIEPFVSKSTEADERLPPPSTTGSYPYYAQLDACRARTFRLSKSTPELQLWFDRALLLCWGFNHLEARRCFRHILALTHGRAQGNASAAMGIEFGEYRGDIVATVAMAHWGVAYTLGVNYNDWSMSLHDMREAYKHARFALRYTLPSKTNPVSEVERMLVAAIQTRVVNLDDPATKQQLELDGGPDANELVPDGILGNCNDAYANAMREAFVTCGGLFGNSCSDRPNTPEHIDVAVLFVEALMNKRPWKMWLPRRDSVGNGVDSLQPRLPQHLLGDKDLQMEDLAVKLNLDPETTEVFAVLSQANNYGSIRHAGLAHFVVHFFELCPDRDFAVARASAQADLLRSQWPAAGHLLHMASHIDMLAGDYNAAIRANEAGILPDTRYHMQLGHTNTYYHTYTLHNHHMLTWAAMFAGDFRAAIDHAQVIAHCRFSRPFYDFLLFFMDGYVATDWHVLIRFGQWIEILDKPVPADSDRFCVCKATAYYAKGIANAVLGNIAAAEDCQRKFHAAFDKIPTSRRIHNVDSKDSLSVGKCMLEGELAYRKGEFEKAFASLRQAVATEDSLAYDEPAGWLVPTRHALGALRMEQYLLDRHALPEVEEAYTGDLQAFPQNLWSLKGLCKCLTLMRQQLLRHRSVESMPDSLPTLTRSCACSSRHEESQGQCEDASVGLLSQRIKRLESQIQHLSMFYYPHFDMADSCLCAGRPIAANENAPSGV